jgi:hypothetical protein
MMRAMDSPSKLRLIITPIRMWRKKKAQGKMQRCQKEKTAGRV